MPQDGFFDFVSSPHMFFEIVMYVALAIMLSGNKSWLLVLLWVIVNQVQNAIMTHKWYLETFPNYPKERKVIIPGIF